MGWTERFTAVGAAANAAWRWIVLAGLVVALVLLARACNMLWESEAKLRRAAEAAELVRLGFVVATNAKQAEFDTAVAKVPVLQAEIERLRKVSPSVRVVTVERIRTVPAPAEGIPRPPPAAGEPCPACLFAPGDEGDIRIDSAHLQTKDGNQVLALSAECWRLKPEPETRILSGTASAPVSKVMVEEPEEPPGWGGGLGAGVGLNGVVGTGLVSPPPFFGRHAELVFGVTAGRGEAMLHGSIIWRP